ncbi:MAG TPA: hypothetical protein VM165_23315 [Planctomycetaceae bacterium]|nr:hypothetical protein [Planctomycetaceae bacterium]
MARPRQHLGVQLFPFLAVLVCVMGSLILLLLVTTQRMRSAAIARAKAALRQGVGDRPILPMLADDDTEPRRFPADEEALPAAPAWTPRPAAPSPDHTALREQLQREWEQRVGQLESKRDAGTQAVVRQKLLAVAVQRRIDELQGELGQLQTQFGQLTGQMSAEKLQPASGLRERVQLEDQIASLRQQLKQLEDQQQSNTGKFSIVPFDGKSGTTRRPILIECTATGLRFVAEGITLTPSDITGFSENYNPLLAGSSALVSYWKQWKIDHPDDDAAADPYVLLLVRPSGTVAYYIAMRMLSPMKQPHGYELITEDLPIAVPPSDAGAKAACREAIKRTLLERQQMTNASRGGSVLTPGTPRAGTKGAGTGTGARPGTGAGSGPERTSEFQFEDVAESPSSSGGRRTENSQRPGGQVVARGPSTGEVVSEGSEPRGQRPGTPSGSASNGTKAAGEGREFQFEDVVEAPNSVGARSWEDPERFEGQEHRRSKPSGTGGNREPPPQGQPPGSLPRETGEEAVPVPQSPPAPRWTERRPVEPPSGPQLTPDVEEQPYPSFAQARKATGQSRDLPYEQLQRRRWGPHDAGASIGVEKTVVVRVDAQRLIVNDIVAIPVPLGASRNQVFDRLLTVIDRQAQTWGKPGSGFFWVPKLKFVIAPGCSPVYERVAPLVAKCGLSSSAEFIVEDAAPARSGGPR